MIYGCSQPRELWFIDFNHVYTLWSLHVNLLSRTCAMGSSPSNTANFSLTKWLPWDLYFVFLQSLAHVHCAL